MSALPYIPLFVADYLADTSHLSTIEHGAYMLLIMNYWQRGGPLPAGDVGLSRIAKLTPKEWASVKPMIAPFFVADGDVWRHNRIETELQKVRDKSEARAKAGKASAEAKAKQKASTSSTHVEQLANYTDTDTNTGREINLSPNGADGFAEFWEAYPKRSGNTDETGARAAFEASDNRDQLTAAAKAYAAWCRENGNIGTRYVKQARAWIADGVWQEWQPKAAVEAVPAGILIKRGMPSWDAWQDHYRRVMGKPGSPVSDKLDGWYFPSILPPEAKPSSEAA